MNANMRPTFRRGYNAALLALRRNLAERIAAEGLSAEQRDTLASVAAGCRQMRQSTRYKPRLATFATAYAISLRTVKNWKAAGCPFTKGRKAVLGWMLQRPTLPAGPRDKFAREMGARAFAVAAKAALDTGRGVSPATDDGARLLLSHRINVAMQAAERLDGEQLLTRSAVAHVSALTKAAVRAGLWD